MTQIIITGAFGTHLDQQDPLTLGMIPQIPPAKITMAGNLAGSGAIMALCDDSYIQKTWQQGYSSWRWPLIRVFKRRLWETWDSIWNDSDLNFVEKGNTVLKPKELGGIRRQKHSQKSQHLWA
ncbi:ASKHA domain-containing protein [Dethiosulfatarculus sandiegensis]|uniref:RACo C-terminal domain-containing protein n=1 Tax=Dethiosulfatarculus sandiegensis TaxID=1429043 RepID=A0A0D2JWP2_9BACT|nr:hypothetical protein X474_12830 [Dethiosulfatarculus sandiegensis]